MAPHDIIQADGSSPSNHRGIIPISDLYPTTLGVHQEHLLNMGPIHCWYAKMQQWFESHGISINALPLSQYCLDYPLLNMAKMEKKRVILTNIINLENKITWINPKISLGTKMAHIKTLFTHIGGWISSGHLISTYIYSMRCVV